MGFRVLVAIDGSQYSEQAVSWYLKNVHLPKNEVILAHVSDVSFFPMFGFKSTESMELWKVEQQQKEETVKALVKRNKETLVKCGVKEVEFVSETGSPGPVLVDIAEKNNADLIVMGTRGAGTLSRTILGSVSDYVMHHAKSPVCICSHNPLPEPPPTDYWSEMFEGVANTSQGADEDDNAALGIFAET
ncbi:hypothetical protein CAPTEDRAFT_221973 [Capitella teleta]|uniref:UspA domain-containing protein n=1 Tax=Capitella teleta TaxID=283909 RepID=R7U3A0_CAPTE|nr:hypothetical protein CAPTEDRAFT_221973 [Capitella teleta]|eukprot:ELU00596.1 hypothetical protein CAPTEDRAFT_221973 [Capitella teleta]